MTLEETMDRLKSLGNEKVRAMNAKNGAGENQYGVKMGDLRTLAKEIKADPALASQLWDTANVDARLLAILLMKPKAISAEDLEAMVKVATYGWLADWLNSYIVKLHPDKERLRLSWLASTDTMLLRAAFSLTAERIVKSPDGLDLDGILDRVENEMADAPAPAQWTMNTCLAEIGIHSPERRARAIQIGERLGIYRDYHTSKGCTSPFAPTWIAAMVSRQA